MNYFTTGQISKALKCSTQTVRDLCARGEIDASRSPGGHYRISEEELERLKALESLPAVPRAKVAAITGNVARAARAAV